MRNNPMQGCPPTDGEQRKTGGAILATYGCAQDKSINQLQQQSQTKLHHAHLLRADGGLGRSAFDTQIVTTNSHRPARLTQKHSINRAEHRLRTPRTKDKSKTTGGWLNRLHVVVAAKNGRNIFTRFFHAAHTYTRPYSIRGC